MKKNDHLLRDALAEAKDVAKALADFLPNRLEIASLGVREKAPFQLLSIREALIWRTAELAGNACSALERDDLTVAAILTRAVVESVAILWRLRSLIEKSSAICYEDLNKDLMNIFAASRIWPEHGRSYQILNFVDLIDRSVPGARRQYDDLSEIAHPNWQGVAGMYSTLDRENHVVEFGLNKSLLIGRKTQIAIILSTFLTLFEKTYNKISELMPPWIERMTPF